MFLGQQKVSMQIKSNTLKILIGENNLTNIIELLPPKNAIASGSEKTKKMDASKTLNSVISVNTAYKSLFILLLSFSAAKN